MSRQPHSCVAKVEGEMNKQQTTTINGVVYDKHTGLRVEVKKTTSSQRPTTKARTIHKKMSKSQTLSRRHVQTPEGHDKARKANATKKPSIAVSPMVSRFADIRPTVKPQAPQKKTVDIGPITHPVQKRMQPSAADTKPHAITKKQPPTASELKHKAISKALQNARPATKSPKKSFSRRHPRLVGAGTASLAIVLLAGYFTYINLPNISVRVAAAQAGIDASYPSYQPAGYGIRGPVAFANGEVSINFNSNTNPSHFTINQSKSNWDSSALLENYVTPQSGDNYSSYTDSGLTIYVYGTHAAWVNGGILHTIDGDAQLSGDQIRHIATSM